MPSSAKSILTYCVSIWLTLDGSGGRSASADGAPLVEECSCSAFVGGGDCIGVEDRRWISMALFRGSDGSGGSGGWLVGDMVASEGRSGLAFIIDSCLEDVETLWPRLLEATC